MQNLALSLQELFLVLAAHNARSGTNFLSRSGLVLANLPEPWRVVLDLDLFIVVNPISKITQIVRVKHVLGEMDEDDLERLAGVAISALNDINPLNAAVTIGVGAEKLAKDAFNVVSIKLVVDARKAYRRECDNIVVGSHDRERE